VDSVQASIGGSSAAGIFRVPFSGILHSSTQAAPGIKQTLKQDLEAILLLELNGEGCELQASPNHFPFLSHLFSSAKGQW
jgi:hypothetical protein